MLHRNVLVAYGTKYGQTAKIATRIADVLVMEGLDVTLRDLASAPPDMDVVGFDAVIVGSSIIVGRHQRSVERFVRRNLEALNRLPTAFFSVSGSAGSAKPEHRAVARGLMERFLTRVGWRPDLETTFAGALPFSRYPWFTRLVMTHIA